MGIKKTTAKTLQGPVAKLSVAAAFFGTALGGGYALEYISHERKTDTHAVEGERLVTQVLDRQLNELSTAQHYNERARLNAQLQGSAADTALSPEAMAAKERQTEALKNSIYTTMMLNPDISDETLKTYMVRYSNVTGTDRFSTGAAEHHDQCRVETKGDSMTENGRLDLSNKIAECMTDDHDSPLQNSMWIAIGLLLFPLHRIPGEALSGSLRRNKMLSRWAKDEKKPKSFGN